MRFSTDAHTARLRHALSCAGSLLLLLGVSQEVAKKETKVFPLGSPLALPLFKDEDEKDRDFLHVSPATKPPRAADMESKRFCGFLKGIRPRIKFNSLWEEFCLQNSSRWAN